MPPLPELPDIAAKDNKLNKKHGIVNIIILFVIGASLVFAVRGITERYLSYSQAYHDVQTAIQSNIQLKAEIISLDADFERQCKNPDDFAIANPSRPVKIKYCVAKLRETYLALLGNTAKADKILSLVAYASEDWLDFVVLRGIAKNATYDYILSKASIQKPSFDYSAYTKEQDPSSEKYEKYLLDQLDAAQKDLNAVDPKDINIPIILQKK